MANILLKLATNNDGDFVYNPGQILNGTVELSLNSSKKINSLYILITGSAKCGWYEKDECSTFGCVRQKGKEVYINSKIFLIKSEYKKLIKMPKGKMVYNFSYELPISLPDSLKVSWFGKIEYKVEAVLDIPWKFDKKICIPFTIKRNDNINTLSPALSQPVHLKSNCDNGKSTLKSSIPQGAFSVLQKIPIRIECENLSNNDIKDITVKLIQEKSVVSFRPKKMIKTFEVNTLKKLRLDGVKGGTALMNREVFIPIPSYINHSNEQFCKVIRVKYTLQVRATTESYQNDLLNEFPITIF